MWAGNSSYAVECVADIGNPVAQRLIHRVLERAGTGLDGAHFGAENLHPQHVGLLPFDVDGAHVYDARQSEFGAKRGGGNAVHAGAGLGDDARLAHAQSQHDLAEHIVHFMRAGVIKFFALEVDLRAAAVLGKALRKIKRRWPADIVRKMAVHLLLEGGVGLGLRIGLLKFENKRHQGLGDKAAAIDAEMPALVGTGPEGIWSLHGHARVRYLTERTIDDSPNWRGGEDSSASAARAARMNARILSGSFSPGARSTPDDTSTPGARVMRKSFRHIVGVEPARKHEGNAGIQILEKGPVERLAETARPRCILGRARVEDQSIHDLRVLANLGKILSLRDRQCLHDRQSKARAHGDDTVRRFTAVELKHVRFERRHDVEQRVIIGVDGERDFSGAPLNALAKRARRLKPKMARTGREEHEADQIGPGIKRHIKRLRGPEAADFDRQWHCEARSSAFSNWPQSGTARLS